MQRYAVSVSLIALLALLSVTLPMTGQGVSASPAPGVAIQQGGVPQGQAVTLNCSTGVTCTGPGPTFTITAGAGGLNQLTGDVLAGPGTGSQVATVAGVAGIPLCGGFTPTDQQNFQLTTSSSPNPCWTATATSSGSGFLFSGNSDPWVPPVPTVLQDRAAAFNSTTTTLAFTSPVTSGNAGVVSVMCLAGSLPLPTITDSLSPATTYSSVDTATASGTTTYIFKGVFGASGANTVSYSDGSSCNAALDIREVGGTTGVVDVHANAAGVPPAVTTTQTADLLLTAAYTSNCVGTSGNPPAVLDSCTNTANGQITLHFPAGVAGSYQPGYIAAPSNNFTAVTMALKATPVASPGNNGDWYINLLTGVLWGPKAGSVWNKSSAAWLNQPGANSQYVLSGSPTMGTCGTGPSLGAGASNNAGTVNVGSGTVTGCTVNFFPNFTNSPACTVISSSTAVTPDISSVSTSAITFGLSGSIGGASCTTCVSETVSNDNRDQREQRYFSGNGVVFPLLDDNTLTVSNDILMGFIYLTTPG